MVLLLLEVSNHRRSLDTFTPAGMVPVLQSTVVEKERVGESRRVLEQVRELKKM